VEQAEAEGEEEASDISPASWFPAAYRCEDHAQTSPKSRRLRHDDCRHTANLHPICSEPSFGFPTSI